MLTSAPHVPGEPDARTKVAIVIMRQRRGRWVVDRFESQIRPVERLGLCADKIEVLVPAQTKIQREITTKFPVILEIQAKHFRAAWQVEIGIAGSR